MKDARPNVIFIIIDSCSFTHTSFGGNARDTTPFLTEFSRQAVQYPLAFSHGPISGISIGSFTTSSYAFDHQDMPIEVGPSRPSIPMLLHDAGYYNALVTSNPYYAKKFGYQHGVDAYKVFFNEKDEIRRMNQQGLFTRMFNALYNVPLYRTGKEWLKRNLNSAYQAGRMGKTVLTARHPSPFGDAAQLNNEILNILRNRPKEKSLFLQVQYMDLHAPNLPPEIFLEKFGKPVSKSQQYIYGQKRNMRPIPAFTPDEVEDLTLLHNACLAHVDSRIQEVLEELKRQGIYDNSLIVITADHGEAFFEHGDLGHHALLYDENIRIPLLIKYPGGLGAGTTCERIVRQIDIAPTIVDVADIRHPQTHIGTSLYPGAAGKGDAPSREHAIAFTAARFSPENVSRLNFKQFQIALRTKNWKLIVHGDREDELYRLDQDPGEQNDLLKGSPSEEMQRVYAELQRTLEPYLNRVRQYKENI